MLKSGFGGLVNSMERNITYANGEVLLGHKVDKVCVRSGGEEYAVAISGVDKTAEQFNIECDFVVVTLPLGVLKANVVTFDPPLPLDKQNAIERLGFGILNKVVLHFENCFWDKSVPVIGHTAVEPGNNFMFVNMLAITGIPILVSLVSGRFAESIEGKSDETVVNETLGVLRNMYRNRPVPPPIDFVVTRWRSNEFSRGSYSYIASGSSPQDIGCISRPIDDTVFFAGEATTMTHFASAHGAVLTGRHEASRITKVIARRFNISPSSNENQ
jgi:lysine-specific histone demethylase 1